MNLKRIIMRWIIGIRRDYNDVATVLKGIDIRPARGSSARRVVLFLNVQASQKSVTQSIVIRNRVRFVPDPDRDITATRVDVVQKYLIWDDWSRKLKQDVIATIT